MSFSGIIIQKFRFRVPAACQEKKEKKELEDRSEPMLPTVPVLVETTKPMRESIQPDAVGLLVDPVAALLLTAIQKALEAILPVVMLSPLTDASKLLYVS